MGNNDTRNRIFYGGKVSARQAWFPLLFMMAALVPVSPSGAQTVWTPMPTFSRIQVLGPSDWIGQEGSLGLKRTKDSGEHWEVVLAHPPDSASHISHLDWHSNGRGLVVYTHVSSKRDSVAYILARTTDDGVSWRFSSFRVCDLFSVPANTGLGSFTGGADSVLLVSAPDGVYRTTNDGAAFTRCALPFSDASLALYGDVNNLWILNGYKRDRIDSLAVSTDGGLSWHVDQAPLQSRNLYTDWRGHVMLWSDDSLFVTTGGERVWHRIPLPVDGYVLAPSQPSRSVAMLDTSDVWLVHENSDTQRMYITRDGGRHWASAETRAHLLHRLDAERALLYEYLLTIPDRQPLVLTATNRSSFARSEALLEWNDPGVCGQIARYTLERAGTDSVWVPLPIDVQPPDQFCFVEQPAAGHPVFRYRLTMQALTGEVFVAVSDTVSMLPGAYVDVLDAILPDSMEDQQLVYEQRTRSQLRYGGPVTDTTYILTYTFQAPEHPSRWITRFPIRIAADGPSGEHWTSLSWIDQFSSRERDLWYDDSVWVGPGYSPINLRHGRQRLIAADEAVGIPDSLEIEVIAVWPYKEYAITSKPVAGVIHSVIGRMPGSSAGSVYNRMILLRTVNGIADIPAAEAVVIGAPYPNPVTTTAVVPFVLTEPGHVTITVHDLLGREVARIIDGHREAGRQQAMLDARTIRPGAWLLRLRTGSTVMTRMFVLQ
jgi:hypothetical protein